MKKYIKLLGVALALILVACEELPCDDVDGVQLNAGFYSYDGVTLSDSAISKLILHFGLEENTIYSDTLSGSTTSVQFPFSMIADSSIVIFEFNEIDYDTLVFHYTKTLHLESHKCGFVHYFEITSIDATNHQIDSVWIWKNIVEYGDEENIKIYF
ncbi:MAG: DUF6452 family protein [Prolixibacteraceae bacterium]